MLPLTRISQVDQLYGLYICRRELGGKGRSYPLSLGPLVHNLPRGKVKSVRKY